LSDFQTLENAGLWTIKTSRTAKLPTLRNVQFLIPFRSNCIDIIARGVCLKWKMIIRVIGKMEKIETMLAMMTMTMLS
jgi:hypothetical protein